MFRVVLNVNEYIVRSYIMTHNHPCTKSFMRCDPWFRRVSEEEKENTNPALQQSASCDAVVEHVRNTYQKEIISPCFKPSKQLLRKMINTQKNGRLIFQKFGERFAMQVFTMIENYTKRILRK
uniref:Uncharacterized protein n=1 Tax=Schistosoma japonicum TaxID=6182 RepID=Q5BYP5_SCHJA|nr:unknown [Schistosoma japonicum]